MINPGELRYRAQFLTAAVVRDEFGAQTEAWGVEFTLRVGLKTNSGAKKIDAEEKFNSRSITIKCYYRQSINDKMRVRFEGNDYRIMLIEPVGYREDMLIHLEKIND